MLRSGFDGDPAAAVLNASGPLNCIPHLLQSREKLVRVEKFCCVWVEKKSIYLIFCIMHLCGFHLCNLEKKSGLFMEYQLD